MTGAGLRGAPALLLAAICRGATSGAAFLRLLASALERSTRSDSCFPGSTQLGPPFLYTPVYVDCMEVPLITQHDTPHRHNSVTWYSTGIREHT